MLKWSNSHLDELKSATKNATAVFLKLSSNVIGDSNDETNFALDYYCLMHNFQRFRKLLQIINQLK